MEWVTLAWFIGHGPIAAALVVGLFWAALVHPERIRSRLQFRLSALCLGASVLASTFVPLTLLLYTTGDSRSDRGGALGYRLYFCALPPIFLSLAIYFGIDSVMAKRARRDE